MLDFSNLYKKHEKEIIEDYFAFLRFQTISADKTKRNEFDQCSKWLQSYLLSIGMKVEIWQDSGAPIVFGELPGKSKDTLLIYHHYDVQPVEPIKNWSHPPFKPIVRNGKVFARGASDNKGQCMYTLSALRVFKKYTQGWYGKIKLLIEGEEESSSASLMKFLPQKKEQLSADYILICDSGIPTKNIPAVTFGVRGIIALEATLHCLERDVHSGMFGNIALNPNRAFMQILSKLWDKEGKITIPGFYQGWRAPTHLELKQFFFPLTKEVMQKEGVFSFWPSSKNFKKNSWFSPSLEITSWFGGYLTEGIKAIIPSTATVKLSCRLGIGQNPERTRALLKKFLEKNKPKGAILEVIEGEAWPAYRTSTNSPFATLMRTIYATVFNQKCRNILIGGSVPIASALATFSKKNLLLIGVSLLSDKVHAPDENFSLEQFKKGFCIMGKIFENFHQLEEKS